MGIGFWNWKAQDRVHWHGVSDTCWKEINLQETFAHIFSNTLVWFILSTNIDWAFIIRQALQCPGDTKRNETQSLVCVNRPVTTNYSVSEHETLLPWMHSVSKQPWSRTSKTFAKWSTHVWAKTVMKGHVRKGSCFTKCTRLHAVFKAFIMSTCDVPLFPSWFSFNQLIVSSLSKFIYKEKFRFVLLITIFLDTTVKICS